MKRENGIVGGNDCADNNTTHIIELDSAWKREVIG